ncbi:MAG: hydroxymethylglutaryl-CoA lyase [Alphaproteobacteria bacterium]|nr:hydroxymethylglutaryl-CoA lyase [Alphaproteobacteria bacterium]
MSLPKKVKIVEVGPRDGLQAEALTLPLETRIKLINLLSQTGLKAIEVGSFVSPRWIPQLAESERVYQGICKKEGIDYSLLVPNYKGYERALENKVTSIAIFTAASETFCKKNINLSIEESLEGFKSFVPESKKKGLRVRGYVSCVIACPYEGRISPVSVHKIVSELFSLGCDEISLGDTIGVGTPKQVHELLKNMPVSLDRIAVHFHDTYGQGLVNVYAALEKGVSTVDSSVSGLGGCPYAPGASGNVATEDIVYFLERQGIETGIDMKNLLRGADFIDGELHRQTTSKASCALRKTKFGRL